MRSYRFVADVTFSIIQMADRSKLEGVPVKVKELEQSKHSSSKRQDVTSLQLLRKIKSNMSDYTT